MSFGVLYCLGDFTFNVSAARCIGPVHQAHRNKSFRLSVSKSVCNSPVVAFGRTVERKRFANYVGGVVSKTLTVYCQAARECRHLK
jgi:hypothetical protein